MTSSSTVATACGLTVRTHFRCESTDYICQMHPVTVWISSAEPPNTGDLVSNSKAGEGRCDFGDIGYAKSELHSGD